MQIIKKFAYQAGDTEDQAFMKLLILLVSLSCCFCGLCWSLLYYYVFGWGLTAMLPLSFVVIVGSVIFISDHLKDHRPLVYAQLFCITWISALIQWSIGSIDNSGLVIAWSFLGPLGAVIFLSFRQSLLWIVMFLVIVVISAVYQPALGGKILEVSETERTIFYIMNIGISSIVVFMTSAWFVKTIQFERSRVNSLLGKIKSLFGQHVSTEVANELIARDELVGMSTSYDATIMFLDIRDFTILADSRIPKEVAAIQNIVFSEYINIVREHKGIVLQILGDGILAVFGAPIKTPEHVQNASKCRI